MDGDTDAYRNSCTDNRIRHTAGQDIEIGIRQPMRQVRVQRGNRYEDGYRDTHDAGANTDREVGAVVGIEVDAERGTEVDAGRGTSTDAPTGTRTNK